MRVFKKLKEGPPVSAVHSRRHFHYNAISALMIFASLVLGLGLEYALSANISQAEVGYIVAGVISAIGLLFFLPWWPVVLTIAAGLWAASMALGTGLIVFPAVVSLGFLITPGFVVVSQWDKIVVLRLGRFHRVRGPGLIFLVPFIDTAAGTIDTRIRVTDFSAEKSLTLDTVPVHIDALAFWMIWDAGKAVLEVQHFDDAVVLSAQTALRSTIGSNSLTALLSERERLGREIQSIVDAKTNPWGITIISVEFKEILVPRELEDVLSREAQAERERKARTILSNTESEISSLYEKAAEAYKNNPTALKLRAMNMIYESMRNKGGLILTPASALETMNLGSVLGAAAYGAQTGLTPEILPANGIEKNDDSPDAITKEEGEKK